MKISDCWYTAALVSMVMGAGSAWHYKNKSTEIDNKPAIVSYDNLTTAVNGLNLAIKYSPSGIENLLESRAHLQQDLHLLTDQPAVQQDLASRVDYDLIGSGSFAGALGLTLVFMSIGARKKREEAENA